MTFKYRKQRLPFNKFRFNGRGRRGKVAFHAGSVFNLVSFVIAPGFCMNTYCTFAFIAFLVKQFYIGVNSYSINGSTRKEKK